VLDEPLAAPDPVAREDFLAAVVAAAQDDGVSAAPVTLQGWNNGAVWVISSWVKAPDGQVLSQSALNGLFQHLPPSVQNSPSPDAFTTWLTQHGYTLWQSVQPDSRSWQFQLTEGGWLLVVSAAPHRGHRLAGPAARGVTGHSWGWGARSRRPGSRRRRVAPRLRSA
jgi:hypothetical protein